MDDLRPEDPQRIGPYLLERRLGSGGMGHVYLGRSPGGQRVAIKVIRAELAGDAEFRARFAREVTAARKVSGIYTADVVDADLHGPVPWLATSYVAGPSLAEEVAGRGPLSAASVLALAAGLAEGLDAIHSSGVVHSDLKPPNVLLAEDGPRLIDFGISRSAEMSPLTRTGMVIGSPGFMSPEQALGHEAGPPSDIFSLGAVLAFAATGRGPFGNGPNEALLDRVVRGRPDTGELPGEIRPLIERCLAKDPLLRPTAAQLLAELSAAQPVAQHGSARPAGGATLLAHPATERVTAPDSRRGNTSAWVPTVTSPDLHPVTASDRYPVPAGQAPRARRHRPPRRGWLIAVIAVAVLAGAAAFLAARTELPSRAPAPANPAPPVTPAPVSPSSSGPAVMAALGSYLARSASVRPAVQTAIDGVRTCSQSLDSGNAALQRAINTRQDILTGLRTLSPAGLPSGAQLISTLTAAMRNSIEADRYYQNWMTNFANSGRACGSDHSQDSAYVAGQNASGAATTAKQTFLDIWNQLASRYGQATYTSADF